MYEWTWHNNKCSPGMGLACFFLLWIMHNIVLLMHPCLDMSHGYAAIAATIFLNSPPRTSICYNHDDESPQPIQEFCTSSKLELTYCTPPCVISILLCSQYAPEDVVKTLQRSCPGWFFFLYIVARFFIQWEEGGPSPDELNWGRGAEEYFWGAQ